MATRSFALLASLLAVALAAPCKPAAPPTYTLPSTGTGSELPAVDASLTLLKVAVGHGIQNYTCGSASAATTATGALAVLYDVTSLYPGTPGTGLAAAAFAALSSTVLWSQDLPLNLQASGAATPSAALAEADYGAVVAEPFPAPAPLALPGVLGSTVPFLGHHYFDASGIPTFDLSAAAAASGSGSGSSLFGSMAKTGDVKAPAGADSGLLATGAVDWLQLSANANGLSRGVRQVYRVTTAGGVSAACSALNASAGSVPYAAFYWFYG